MKVNTFDRALLYVSRIGVFLVPFVPLIITASMFFPFITGKNFAFRIIVEVVFAAWLLLAFRDSRFRPRKSLLLWGMLAFLGVVLVADLFAENPFKALWSNFERMEGFVTLAHLGAYFLVASSVLDTEKWWHRFFATSVCVSAFLGIYGVLQLAGKIVINQGGMRLDGTFGNAAYFAGYMLFHIFLTLFLILRHRVPSWVKWLYGGALLLQGLTLFFTATRGAAVGLFGGLFLATLLVAIFERKEKRLRAFAIGSIAVLALGAGTLYGIRKSAFVEKSPVLTRFASISVKDAGPRFMVWGMAWEGFKKNPILGWGQEGFNYVFNKYYDPNMWAQEQWFDRTHNTLLDWLIAAGLLGLLAYLFLYAVLLRYIWKNDSALREAPFSLAEKGVLTGLLAGYLVHNLFVFDNIGSYLLFFSLLAFFASRAGEASAWMERLPAVKGRNASAVWGSCMLALLALGLYVFNIRGILVARELIEALKPHPKGVSENLRFYRAAAASDTLGGQEVAEQALQAAASVAAAPNLPADLKNEFVSFAAGVMERELARAPNDARLYMFQGMFYNRLGRRDEALTYLAKAHALSPTKQAISFELASADLNAGKNADALALLHAAFDSAPKFPAARLTYAVGAIYAKEFALADELLKPVADKDAVTNEQVVKAYYDVKRYDKVLAIWKARVEKSPKDPQVRVSLAAAYLLNGYRKEAIAELETAIKLNPAFKEQGEYFIKEIRAGRNP